MRVFKTYFILIVFLTLFHFHDCGKSFIRIGSKKLILSPLRPHPTEPVVQHPPRNRSYLLSLSRIIPPTTPRPKLVLSTRSRSIWSNPRRIKTKRPRSTTLSPFSQSFTSTPSSSHRGTLSGSLRKFHPTDQQHHEINYINKTMDTGSIALGVYLGYSLGRLTSPAYSHDKDTPRYDHYIIYHYYHNRERVRKRQEIYSNNIMTCAGDSAAVCPANTTSLCTTNGALRCVAAVTATQSCVIDGQITNCVTSTISCVNNTATECKNSKNNGTIIDIPCLAHAIIYGQIQIINNTVTVGKSANNTNVTVGKSTNNTNVTVTKTNSNVTITTTPEKSTPYPITTTPISNSTANLTVTSQRKTSQQNFCVVVLARPAKKNR